MVLFLLPLIARRLGAELYGAWALIQQSVGYLVLGDLRAMGALKYTLAVRQHMGDVAEKRRQIGSALLLSCLTLPLVVALAVLAVWAAPSLLQTQAKYDGAVRAAMAITVASFGLDRFLSLPAGVLRGMNLDYKGMGLDAAAILTGGVLSGVALSVGLGLPGVAAGALVSVVLLSIVRFFVAKSAVPWFGVDRPERREFLAFTKTSLWLFVGELAALLFFASDIVLVGILMGPVAAASYATTQALLRLAQGPLLEVLACSGPGMAMLGGQGSWGPVAVMRRELHILGVGMMAVLGTTVASLNASFVSLWLGPRFYGGDALNLLLVLITGLALVYRTETLIADSSVAFRSRAKVTMVGGVSGVTAATVLGGFFGPEGVAAGILVGRLAAIAWLPRSIARKSGGVLARRVPVTARGAITAILLVVAGAVLPADGAADSWPRLIAAAVGVAALAGLVWFRLGVCAQDRHAITARVLALRHEFYDRRRTKGNPEASRSDEPEQSRGFGSRTPGNPPR